MGLEEDYRIDRHAIVASTAIEVCRCVNTRTEEVRAVKLYHKDRLNERRIRMALEEGTIAKELPRYPQLVHSFAVYDEADRVAIVMEFMIGGSLFQQLTKHGAMAESRACLLARHLFTGIAALHRAGVMHRDIKPENLFLRLSTASGSHGKGEEVLALGDFGFATRQIPDHQFVGSPQYCAPEVALIALQQHQGEVTRPLYNEKCDIWAAGVVVFVMLSGLLPFDGPTPTDICTAVLRGTLPFEKVQLGRISPTAKAFLQYVMTPNPSRRPSAAAALRHTWLT